MRKRLLLATVALLMAGSVSAADQDAATPESAKPAEKPKLICKTDTMTGSLTRRTRTCKTAEQWNALASSTQQDVNRFVRGTDSAAERMPSRPVGQ